MLSHSLLLLQFAVCGYICDRVYVFCIFVAVCDARSAKDPTRVSREYAIRAASLSLSLSLCIYFSLYLFLLAFPENHTHVVSVHKITSDDDHTNTQGAYVVCAAGCCALQLVTK